jgi:hypothetical protein
MQQDSAAFVGLDTSKMTIQQFSFSIFEDALWGLARFFEE